MQIKLNQDRNPSFPFDQLIAVFDTVEEARAAAADLAGAYPDIEEVDKLYLVDEALRDGRVLLRVPCSPSDASAIGDVATAHGGEMIAWFGRHSMVSIPSS